MIKRLFEWVAKRFTDTDWLYERRKQEVLSRREAQHIEMQESRESVNFLFDRITGNGGSDAHK